MSKIAEQKALEAYPVKKIKDNFGTRDINRCMREACVQGYDQAMQDFLEKAMKYLEGKPIHPVWVEGFKKYIQNEII